MTQTILLAKYRSKTVESTSNFDSVATVIPLFSDFSRLLPSIQKKMRVEFRPYHRRFLLSVRPQRQQFCFLARKCSGFSIEELCERLNGHSEILKMSSYPSFNYFYPIVPELISNLETDISKIAEYCRTGFLFGIGIPTPEIASAIADICGVTKEHDLFVMRCNQYLYGVIN